MEPHLIDSQYRNLKLIASRVLKAEAEAQSIEIK